MRGLRGAFAAGLLVVPACFGRDVAPPPSPEEIETISGPTEERQRTWMLACDPPPPPPPPAPGKAVDRAEQERFELLVRQFREAVGVDSCDPDPWLKRQSGYPEIEGLYCVLSVVYDVCEQPDQALVWAQRRASHFGQNPQAHLALGVRRFEALWPAVDSLAPYNERLSGEERFRIAGAVIDDLTRAIELDPMQRDPYVYLAMAHTQRQFARYVPDTPRTDRELLDTILAREDAMLAHQAMAAICKLDQIPSCTEDPAPGCCPEPPLTPAEQQRDAQSRDRLVQKLGPVALETSNFVPAAARRPEPLPSVKADALDMKLEAVMANQIYTPDPDPKDLAATQTGLFSKESGASKISFCVDTRGRTTDIAVAEPFPNDPKIDDICMAAVGKWRFKPFRIDGESKAVCSEISFALRFE